MSNIYIQEPPTSGKVLLVTSCDEIDIELWSKEAPKACRNFVQLCMEGYYDNTIFHRIEKGFVVQGGDPTGTGEGGESIYGHPFKDEFHQRLRFNRRGLVAMANAGPNDNASQFFFTLDRADHLNGKHTIFGKVTGPTLYNMIQLAERQVGPDHRPYNPPIIKRTEILSNPFDDIIPRQLHMPASRSQDDDDEPKVKGKKNFSLLSFGDEAEEDEEEVNIVSKGNKLKSSHDVLTDDPKLSSQPAISSDELRGADVASSSRKRRREDGEDSDYDSSLQMRNMVSEKLHKKKKSSGDDSAKTHAPVDEDKEDKFISNREKESARRKAELRREVLLLKKELSGKGQQENSKSEEKKSEESVPESVADYRRQKQAYKEKKAVQIKKGASREGQTLALLEKFSSRLSSAQKGGHSSLNMLSKYAGDDDTMEKNKDTATEEDEEDDSGWMTHTFAVDDPEKEVRLAKDANVQNEDTYDLFDPRNPLNKRRRGADRHRE